MGVELMMEDEHDLFLRELDHWEESVRSHSSMNSSLNSSLNSSMSSVTMFTGDFLSHSGDSLSTIRTYDLLAADTEDRMGLDQSRDNRPTLPGRCSSYRSVISEMSPTSISELSPTYPRRFSDSTKESTDTIPVLPKRDLSVCSSYSSCRSMLSEDSLEWSPKPAGSRARIVRDSIAAALRSKPALSLPPAFSKAALKKPLKSLPAIEESPNPRRRSTLSSPKMTRQRSLPSSKITSPSSRTPKRTVSPALFDRQLKLPERKQFSSGTENDTLPKKPVSYVPEMEGDSGHTTDTEKTARMSGSSSSSTSADGAKRRKSKKTKKSSKSSSDKKSSRKSSKEGSPSTSIKSSAIRDIPPPPAAPKLKLEAKQRRSPITRRQSIHTHMNVPARSLPRSQQKALKKQRSAMNLRRSLIKDSLAIILEDDGEEVDVLTSALATINTA
eukprot:CAMPEP_0117026286 /NCGR_PEP_ID=MMETSP0472-20121206/19342_1 /TAXON_ID=693140 ORGANISM="Tiarina fusus, Strain LIS" /NCGR_SAMPLE_ID=MMETSP0472 /ASSEMBLY_ACC=CAM_ASM_000603 /LENGTH=441 /DNA_ID=CAMNT_0004733255 /DNA_START=51 /DNA_END=1379 /DNA_ORIENTATION=-